MGSVMVEATPADIQGGGRAGERSVPGGHRAARFHALYRDHFDFVFRNLCRMGVPRDQVDDAVQDTFIVVLRRLDDFEDGTHPKAWLFAIALRVARDHRRRLRRKGISSAVPPEQVHDGAARDPFEHAASRERLALLHRALDTLDEDKRAVFVMTEFEQLAAPEISRALDVNLNTVYTRLRAARRLFAAEIKRLQLAAAPASGAAR